MTSLHCFLLFAVSIHSCPQIVTALLLPHTLLTSQLVDNSVERLAMAVNYFTTDLYEKILESGVKKKNVFSSENIFREENVFFSPTSIYVALAMIYAGSSGETKSQLASALHLDVFDSNENQLYESIKVLLQTLSSTTNIYSLKMANRLFGQKGFQFKDEYLKKTEEYFPAELGSLYFTNDPSGSRSKINSWGASMTANKIKELFPTDAIVRDKFLALANAVYSNGSWLYKFKKVETTTEYFFIARVVGVPVPTMHLQLSEGLRYLTSDHFKFKLLELPYIDKSVSMMIVLDDAHDNFNMFLRRQLIDSEWDEVVDVFTNVTVRLSLPKFNLQQTVNLNKPLQALGIKNLFESAELSGIVDSAPLKLIDAYHKAYIAVDEEGTEAAPATGIGMMPMSDVIFIVDKTFLFLLVEKTTGCILFFGYVQNPIKTN